MKMREELISFETAKLAKEKGFIFPKHADMYVVTKVGNMLSTDGPEWKEQYPTQSLLQSWIRVVHGIDVIAFPTSSSKYIFRLYQKGETCKNQIYGDYMSKEYANYEEALGKGLHQALKLI